MDDLRTLLSRFIWTDGIIQDELLFQLRSIPNHRDHLLDIIKEDIEYLAADDDIEDLEYDLIIAFHLLAYLEEPRAFSLLCLLGMMEEEKLDSALGFDFLGVNAGCLMGSFLQDQPEHLFEVIENSSYNFYFRISALSALTYLVGTGSFSRTSAAHYLKNLLQNILNDFSPDIPFITNVIGACCDIYPLEMTAEIRKAFAMNLVDTQLIDTEFVEEVLALSFEEVMDELQESSYLMLQPLDNLQLIIRSKGDLLSLDDDERGRFLEQMAATPNTALSPSRNDPCICGSGKKYKKCCLYSSTDTFIF
jgi:hypothetical protein